MSSILSTVLFPRIHLAEIEDQSWCPSWLREHSHRALARMWQTRASKKGTPAEQACDILLRNIGGADEAAKYTFIDSCAGAGGPTPLLEKAMNKQVQIKGHAAVPFVLTDLWPDLKAWEKIAAQSKNVSYIETPVDATKAVHLAKAGNKECRIFNLCFHHFQDPAASKVLASAIESADAFIIFEMTHRTLPALLNTGIVVLSPLITTLIDYWWSPWQLLFTYLIPIVPLFYFVDGFVSCTRGRSAEETSALIKKQKNLDVSGWEFRSGEQLVLPPFGTLYWYAGVKKTKSL